MKSTKQYIRNGKPLSYWLWKLLDEDPIQAYPAALEIQKFVVGVPNGYSDILDYCRRSNDSSPSPDDIVKRQKKIPVAIKSAINSEDFDTKTYIHALYMRLFKTKKIRSDIIHRKLEQENRVIDKLFNKVEKDLSDENLELQVKRLIKSICYDCDQTKTNVKYSTSLTDQIGSITYVFNALDEELLMDQKSLMLMIHSDLLSWQAREALERIGPKAEAFLPLLLGFIEKNPDDLSYFRYSKAIASIIRDNTQKIKHIIALIDAKDTYISKRALEILASVAKYSDFPFREYVPVVIQKTKSNKQEIVYAAIVTLGKIGHGAPEAIDCLLECSSREDNYIKALSITALGELAEQPERVIPRLIELFDEYEEGDPDYTYDSDHSRIATALSNYGPAAKEAVPTIISHLRRQEKEDGYDRELLLSLCAMENEALPALPSLEKLAKEYEYTEEFIQNASKQDDVLGYLIRTLREYQ